MNQFGVGVLVVVWIVAVITGFRMPWQPIVVSDGDSGAAIRQAVFSVGGLCGLYALLSKGRLSRTLGLRPLHVLLAIGLLASALYSTDRLLTLKRSLIFTLGLTLLLACVHLVHSPLRTMQRISVTTLGTLAWVSLAAFIALPKACSQIDERPGLSGVTNHPNTLAPCMELGLVLSLGVTARGMRRKVSLRTMQLALLSALLLTKSATSISLLVVSCGIYFVLAAKPYRRGAIVLAALIVAGLVVFVGTHTIKKSLLDAAGKDESLSGRDELWSAVIHEGMKSPVFGLGYGAFWYEGRGRELVTTWNPRQSHNAYIDVFVDVGVVGLIVVAVAFAYPLLTGWQSYAGVPGTPRRRAVASLVAANVGLLSSFAMSQSFLFKLDSFVFFQFLWIILLLDNRDANNISDEFARTESVAVSFTSPPHASDVQTA